MEAHLSARLVSGGGGGGADDHHHNSNRESFHFPFIFRSFSVHFPIYFKGAADADMLMLSSFGTSAGDSN